MKTYKKVKVEVITSRKYPRKLIVTLKQAVEDHVKGMAVPLEEALKELES